MLDRLAAMRPIPFGIAAVAGGVGLLVASMPALHSAAAPSGELAEITMPSEILPPARVVQPIEAAPPPHTTQLLFVFTAGGDSYVRLDDAVATMRYRHAHVVNEDGATAAIAAIDGRDLTSEQRAWLGRSVIVDGTCRAKVTGFAAVARLTGDPAYAGDNSGHWTAASLFEHGDVMVAAKLDRCTGTFARDAALAPIIVPRPVADVGLASKARARLLASDLAVHVTQVWRESGQAGDWVAAAELDTRIVRHPVTGVTWISVHASNGFTCGGTDINIWGLYRVAPNGDLVTVQQRDLPELGIIESLVDVEGDGDLEVIGQPFVEGDQVLITADGEELARMPLQFFGCPC